MIITFIGHSTLPTKINIEKRVRTAILSRVPKGERVQFYCGGYGEFDTLCARVAHQVKGEFAAGETVYITPYLHGEERLKRIMESGLYDSSLYPPLENVPYRYAVVRRNEWMVRQADLILSYVVYPWGGAAKTLAYARRKKQDILDLTTDGDLLK